MDEDVLELTQMVQEDGSIVNVDEEREAWPTPAASNQEPETAREPVERPVEIRPMEPPAPEPAGSSPQTPDEDLVSETVRTAASAALAQLAGSVKPRSSVALHSSGPTLEDIVRDMLKPMLREWLDENLPPLVERLVEREIEKMVRRAQGG